MKILSSLCLFLFVACEGRRNHPAPSKVVQPGVLQVGRIEHPRLTESSGVVVSRRDPGLFWTHNDGGGKRQVLYGMTRAGAPVAEFRVSGVVLEDWEDIAADDRGHLFLGDIGNNDARRTSVAVHQVKEPEPAGARTGLAPVVRSWTLNYPAAPFDCESLFVWGEYGYLVSKVFDDARAGVYRFSLTNDARFQTLEAVGELRIDSPVTGADIGQDGAFLGIVAKNGAYVYRIDGDVRLAVNAKPFHDKFKHDHIEACTFVPEGLLATAESREIFLFTHEAFRTGPKRKK
jgi:hypothetical protein